MHFVATSLSMSRDIILSFLNVRSLYLNKIVLFITYFMSVSNTRYGYKYFIRIINNFFTLKYIVIYILKLHIFVNLIVYRNFPSLYQVVF